MKTLFIMRGIPGAGKSTKAKKLVDEHFERGEQIVRFNLDDLRSMGYSMNSSNYNERFSKGRENIIKACMVFGINEALNRGFNVIVDNVNAVWGAIHYWIPRGIPDLKIVILDPTCDFETAVKRNSERPKEKQVPLEAIKRFSSSFESSEEIQILDTKMYPWRNTNV
jgi:tRNA uridine 5-carbamoylmethylation protein Kti12